MERLYYFLLRYKRGRVRESINIARWFSQELGGADVVISADGSLNCSHWGVRIIVFQDSELDEGLMSEGRNRGGLPRKKNHSWRLKWDSELGQALRSPRRWQLRPFTLTAKQSTLSSGRKAWTFLPHAVCSLSSGGEEFPVFLCQLTGFSHTSVLILLLPHP